MNVELWEDERRRQEAEAKRSREFWESRLGRFLGGLVGWIAIIGALGAWFSK